MLRIGLFFLLIAAAHAQSVLTTLACDSSTRPAVVTATEAQLYSLYYPGTYPDNAYCEWILRPEGNFGKIRLSLDHFNTESCCDRLFVYNSQGSQLLSLSGTRHGQEYEFDESEVRVVFDSDPSVRYNGFSITYQAIYTFPVPDFEAACNPLTLPVYIDSAVTYLQPYGRGDREYCFFVYRKPNSTEYDEEGFYISLNSFNNMEAGQLAIYSGVGKSGNVIYEFYGESDAGQVLWAREEAVSVEYSSIDDTNSFFNITIFPRDRACATGTAREIYLGSGEGILQSPGYPVELPDFLSCNWIIKTVPGNTITVYNNGLDLDTDIYCEKDFVELMDGDDATAPSFGRFCDYNSFFSLTSSGNSMQVILRSDEAFPGKLGFNLVYQINGDDGSGEGSGDWPYVNGESLNKENPEDDVIELDKPQDLENPSDYVINVEKTFENPKNAENMKDNVNIQNEIAKDYDVVNDDVIYQDYPIEEENVFIAY